MTDKTEKEIIIEENIRDLDNFCDECKQKYESIHKQTKKARTKEIAQGKTNGRLHDRTRESWHSDIMYECVNGWRDERINAWMDAWKELSR